MGDLIADAFGFFGERTGHSSGGVSLFDYCQENDISPKELYIGWVDNAQCPRCAENYVYDDLEPRLNLRRPSKCNIHPDMERAFAAFRRSIQE